MSLAPAIAEPVPGVEHYPRIAILARNDVPFDAQTAAAQAAQLGAPIFITPPTVLSEDARNAIDAFNPSVLVVAGGPAAISDDVAASAAAACNPDCTIDRRAGGGRDATAAALAGLAGSYGYTRPVLVGTSQVVGDVHIGGTLEVDAIRVNDGAVVPSLNADRLDGLHASDLAPMWAHVRNDGSVIAQSGGITVKSSMVDGQYVVVFPSSVWDRAISATWSPLGVGVTGRISAVPCGGAPQGASCGSHPNDDGILINLTDDDDLPRDGAFWIVVH